MKIRMCIIGVLVLLLGCSGANDRTPQSTGAETVIDWVDFVRLKDHNYTRLYDVVITHQEEVSGQEAGKISFKVAGAIHEPDYKVKDGDAAFLEIGTPLYPINGYKTDQLLAVKDPEQIGGYRVYAENEYANSVHRSYSQLPKEQITRIGLYTSSQPTPYRELKNGDKDRFIQLLDSGKDTEDYTPRTTNGDPDYYTMVFFTEGTLSYSSPITDDGANVFFPFKTTRIVDAAIRSLLLP